MTKSRGIRVPKGTRPAWVAENEGKHFCKCGCGRVIPLDPTQYPRIPEYVWGHNPGPNKRELVPNEPCLCGCGKTPKTPGGKWLAGHNIIELERKPFSAETRAKMSRAAMGRKGLSGPASGTWKGGRIVHGAGYVQLWARDHPFNSKGYVMEHRLIMEAHLRETDPDSPYLIAVDGVLYLRPEIEVHHLNLVKDDNRLENFQCLTKAQHASEHARLRREAKAA